VRAVSIGFRALKYAFKEDGGVDYQEIEIYEMSSVSIPALPEAVITSVKSMNPSLSHAMAREIKRFDMAARNPGGPVPLIQPVKHIEPALLGGAVRLIQPK
jgi:phage head maturation protease